MSTRRRREARRRKRVAEGVVVALSFLAGMSDAIGFLLIGDYVSFMSGNTTNLAVALAGLDASAASRGALLIGAFVLGNAASALVMSSADGRQGALLLLVAFASAVPALVPDPTLGLLAFASAMGLLNGAVDQVDGQGVGLTYVTGALTRIGRGLGRRLLGDRSGAWRVQVLPWAGVLSGGFLGAVVWLHARTAALFLPAVLAAALAILVDAVPASWRRRWLVEAPRV